MHLSGVRLSICLSQHAPQQQTLLLWARPARDIDRLLHGAQQRGVRRVNAGSSTLSAYAVAEHRLVLTLCRFR